MSLQVPIDPAVRGALFDGNTNSNAWMRVQNIAPLLDLRALDFNFGALHLPNLDDINFPSMFDSMGSTFRPASRFVTRTSWARLISRIKALYAMYDYCARYGLSIIRPMVGLLVTCVVVFLSYVMMVEGVRTIPVFSRGDVRSTSTASKRYSALRFRSRCRSSICIATVLRW
jgi:hypothetical protein